ncbi:hypothetical protein IWX85_000634 [Polaromonas sp. CG_9.11]|nr:hypothetical protein [Polaromonas sp. CG_9.11]
MLAADALRASNGNPTYRGFTQIANLSHEALNLRAGVRVRGAVQVVQNVKAHHGSLKPWLQRLHGVAHVVWTATCAGFAPWTTTTPLSSSQLASFGPCPVLEMTGGIVFCGLLTSVFLVRITRAVFHRTPARR